VAAIRPFLKWAGGKFRLAERIKTLLPPGSRLIEPFVGSAAVFLNTAYQDNLLADANADLILVYQILKDSPANFIALCRSFFTPDHNQADTYYALRQEFNTSSDPWRKAALFVYLNRHGYNGLCRYNSKGGFNVPFGRYRHPYFPQAEFEAFAVKAQHAQFMCADFRAIMAECRPGDVVYCDPPYVPLTATANFTGYHPGGFSSQDQEDLVLWAKTLGERGIPVLISNHASDWTHSTYQSAHIETFAVRRFISCDGSHRDNAQEVLALFGPPS
jgi:DNA adenine methylase